jgi:phospholipase C
MTAPRAATSRIVAAAVAAGALALAAAAAAAPPSRAALCGADASRPAPARVAHVVWIWFENHGYADIVGSHDAPYLNAVAAACGLATNYHALVHPSLPNYIAATSGSTQGIEDDAGPAVHRLAVASLFGQVGGRSYEQSMPFPCALTDIGRYAVKHDPQAYYLPVRARCPALVLPLPRLDPRALPRFAFVTPDLCSDMHSCPVADGDAWLRGFLPRLTRSPGYRAGRTVVFVTFDEAEAGGDNRVATLVLSEWTRPGTRSPTRFDHYSLLRTSEDLLGVPPLENARTARDMRRAFHL